MQSQLLVAVPGQTQEQQNISLGIVQPLNFPYNLFLNFKTLADPDSPFIYFFVYLLGPKKVVLWGIYDKRSQRFSVDGGCRYTTDQLAGLVRTWKGEGVNYVANSVRNRPSEITSSYVGPEVELEKNKIAQSLGISRPVMTRDEYVTSKYILGYYDDKISKEEVEERFPGLLESFWERFLEEAKPSQLVGDVDYKFTEYLDDLYEKTKKYENQLNRRDLSTQLSVEPTIVEVIRKITERFYEAIGTGRFESSLYYNALQRCPSLNSCQMDTEGSCEVYYYGDVSKGYVNPRDPRTLL